MYNIDLDECKKLIKDKQTEVQIWNTTEDNSDSSNIFCDMKQQLDEIMREFQILSEQNKELRRMQNANGNGVICGSIDALCQELLSSDSQQDLNSVGACAFGHCDIKPCPCRGSDTGNVVVNGNAASSTDEIESEVYNVDVAECERLIKEKECEVKNAKLFIDVARKHQQLMEKQNLALKELLKKGVQRPDWLNCQKKSAFSLLELDHD